jgi:nucleoside-diphosphate-sugar epimerase
MKILITGGTGVIGEAVKAALTDRGHQLRILSRGADSSENTDQIEYWRASVTDAAALAGAAADCDVVLHVAGIVAETPPDLTFESVNVEGTRNIVREADISAVRRFVYVSSFGADTGTSDYHKSKREAEEIARTFPRDVVVVRPGNVYGPGDEVISSFVKMVRAFPVIPIIDSGDQEFQPVWHEDVGEALAAIIEDSDIGREPVHLLGPEVVTLNRLLDIMAEITGQEPTRVPLPSGIAGFAARLAAKVGIDIPLKPDVLQMLLDGNALRPGQTNALEKYVSRPTPVTVGMRHLLECMPEQELEDGYGKAQHRKFTAHIRNPQISADELFNMFCADYDRFLPVQKAEQQGNPRQCIEGETIALSLPVRGDIAVRVEEASNNAVTLVTVDGHPLAGFVRFTWVPESDGLTFEINVYDRPATLIDTVAMALGGSYAQRATWIAAVERMIEESKGEAAEGVQHSTTAMSEEAVAEVQEWLDNLRASRAG